MPGLQIFSPRSGERIKGRKNILASGWADPTTDSVSGECRSDSGSVIQGNTVAYFSDPGAPGRPAGYRWLILFENVPVGTNLLTVTREYKTGG